MDSNRNGYLSMDIGNLHSRLSRKRVCDSSAMAKSYHLQLLCQDLLLLPARWSRISSWSNAARRSTASLA